ncbi:MAG: glycosyltransferase family 2 protein, partial [Kangiella sp.]|nr:glycosyltransferase family 2 protein [Kangiella sp.]
MNPHPTEQNTEVVISIIAPVYNESEVIEEFHRRLDSALQNSEGRFEIIYVNDGSTDDSLFKLQALREQDPRISIIDLSRNFGKEIALTAGLDHAAGAAAIVIDTDLQDPPELIPDLIGEWKQGYEVVYEKRVSREGETFFKKATAHAFYRVIQKISQVKIPEDTGDFRLIGGRALASLRTIRERNRFMKGLFTWIGYSQKAVLYQRDPRYAGTKKWNYWKLWNFALEGITSFTSFPLKVATYIGLAVAVVAFIYA